MAIGQPGEDLVGLLRPERAVHADRVRAREGESRREPAPPLSPKAVRPSARNVIWATIGIVRREAAHRADRLGRLERAAEGLEQDEVRAGVEQDAGLLLEDLAHLDEGQGPYGLTRAPRGPDRAGDEDEVSGGRFPREPDPFPVDLFERVGPLVGGELDPVGVPRVGREDPGARVHGSRRGLRGPLPGSERLSGDFACSGAAPARDEQRPHGAVGEEHLAGDGFSESLFS